jgi:hypothetical protein
VKKYKIHYEYQTGDSFGHHDENGDIEVKWDNLDIAKENLQRIKEHYQYYCELHGSRPYETPNQWGKTIEGIKTKYRHKPWFVEQYDLCLMLKSDEGKEFQYYTSWCGYFEELYGVKIQLNDPSDEDGMSFSFR